VTESATDHYLNRLATEAHAISVEKGWYERSRDVPELIALAHSELSEALECYRDNPDPCGESSIRVSESGKPEGLAIELADTVIRIADIFGYYGLDMQRAVDIKMAYNRTRPHRHGGKRAWAPYCVTTLPTHRTLEHARCRL